ncbi:LEAF RUST 10 DISEASE-RESISTANCE LOCUS RECEPTOR-LIKE PROTEIN KINASE-like 1.1 [Mangifera indica]|uniref:LEAF RUST 10 DISEASE-RESISTANCE LOCUS RECEPTOR-LIKE PROTEIN KINASE-like 1.1 n=1 Tax=Mangifera indica TaxID=29780 RepID=UPI001CFBAF88|nr:LEAF RUST 10 DISEASE-RESISTANCE LOCUS RECEPTOR-LIKE PROTEIN KINASE-like 1.1 [Mangifera indica]
MAMDSISYSMLFAIILLLGFALALAVEEEGGNPRCKPFECGSLGPVGFPFFNGTNSDCGFLKIDNCSEQVPRIKLHKDWPWFYVTAISQTNTITLQENETFLRPVNYCAYRNLSLPSSPFLSVEPYNQTFFRCPAAKSYTNFTAVCKQNKNFTIGYQNDSSNEKLGKLHPDCSVIQLLVNKSQKRVDFLKLYTGWFRLQLNVTRECIDCFRRGGVCQDNQGQFQCSSEPNSRTEEKSSSKLGPALGIGIGAFAILVVVLLVIWKRKKQKYTSPSFNSRYIPSDPSAKSELDVGSVCFGVPVFSYKELAEATNNFSHEKEIGDGGFGRVYYAKLKDGREVAVKRFHEHNYRKFEQFMNEIEILTRLRHKNLVTLYGCTSRHSPQGLLLVYEFIPNGTVADHLHGEKAKPGSLPWPIRMNIAIETASALAYLHASDIIHRDVKTNNILLDSNFNVKVADFGLSRLFPIDVTHVSTTPQGSPGYVDPEYHLCYQLTDKSDVYSFGVVLIELISSMPPVDMDRQKQEINLAYLAVNRIQNCLIEELIDPSLGFQSDEQVKRMTTSVAELAFLCLQQNKEMRPSMDAVLEELKRIEGGECKPRNLNTGNELLKSMQPTASSPDCDESSLLKNIRLSPTSVTTTWTSTDTTSTVSC